MNQLIYVFAGLGALIVANCGPQAQTPSAPPAEIASAEDLGVDAPGSEGPLGWLEADGAGETAALYRAGPNAIEFSLTCDMTAKMLTINAEQPEANMPADSKATFFAGATAFEGVAQPLEESPQLELQLPVTPALLKALAEATSVRVTVGDAFTETGQDDKQTLAHLAQSCALITGVKP